MFLRLYMFNLGDTSGLVSKATFPNPTPDGKCASVESSSNRGMAVSSLPFLFFLFSTSDPNPTHAKMDNWKCFEKYKGPV